MTTVDTPVPRQAPTGRHIRWSKVLRDAITHVVLILVSVMWVLPVVWMVSTSLKTDAQIFTWPPQWIPRPFRFENYPEAVSYIPLMLYARNTLIICAATVVGSLFSCPLVAYGLARVPWKGRNVLFTLTLATMMLPFQVIMIPLFVMFTRIHWTNTWLPLIVPSFFGSAFYIFLLRQFFMQIPQDLIDAARIDGANEFGIFMRIILPLVKPALAVITLFEVLHRWGDFMAPLIYLNEARLYTISLGLQQYRSERSTEWGYLMAASTIVTAPVIALFIFTQRTFIEGITLTGIKG
ncbi:MAG: carbohydrate ABC transporter permease [Anaerolineae bacterium]|jgi:multiple sugar transport system permease protein